MTIKYTIPNLLLFLFPLLALAQDSSAGMYFLTNSKAGSYYIDVKKSVAYVYEIGSYLDKAGTGYSIRSTDTLTRQTDNNYAGKTSQFINEENKYYLIRTARKTKKIAADQAKTNAMMNHNLNNAYYLDNYFKMSEVLNNAYPLNHHSFRNGFSTWKTLPIQDAPYMQFRDFANSRLKEIKDSISNQQDKYVTLTSYIVQHLHNLDYSALKESLRMLPATYGNVSKYYGTVINEVAQKRPDYFFMLAEDFPNNQGLIFASVTDKKEVMEGFKAVAGHDTVKKAFFKDRRFGKTMLYKIIGTYAVIIGLLTLLIVSQK